MDALCNSSTQVEPSLSSTYPDKSILGNDEKTPPVAEKTVECDDLLISSAFVYELDETLAHYDLRGEISRKIGYALAENYDRRIFRAITKAARQPSPVTMSNFVEPGGSVVKLVLLTVQLKLTLTTLDT